MLTPRLMDLKYVVVENLLHCLLIKKENRMAAEMHVLLTPQTFFGETNTDFSEMSRCS